MEIAGLDNALDRAVETGRRALEASSVPAYEAMDHALRDLDGYAREAFQHLNRAQFEVIAGKLERGGVLTDLERESLEWLVVGDAQFYTMLENNVQDWQHELIRLLDNIESAKASSSGLETMLRIRALSRDAIQVITSMLFFLRERERVVRFREAMAGDHPDDGRFLARIVRDMLESPSR